MYFFIIINLIVFFTMVLKIVMLNYSKRIKIIDNNKKKKY